MDTYSIYGMKFHSTKIEDKHIEDNIEKIMINISDQIELKNKKIFFKPNLTNLVPKDGVTTNIKMIKAISKFCFNNGINHVYGKGDAAAYSWIEKKVI